MAYEINRVRLINLNDNASEFESFMTTIHSIERELSYYKGFMKAIQQDVPTNKSIDDFTKVLGISKTHLNRVCQTIVGESTKQVIANYLINKSMILLAHTDMTISEIAHHLDFKDVSYFCRFF